MTEQDDLIALATWLEGDAQAAEHCAKRAVLDPALVEEARIQRRLHLLLRAKFTGPDAATVADRARRLADGTNTLRRKAHQIASQARSDSWFPRRLIVAVAALLAVVIGGMCAWPSLTCIAQIEAGQVAVQRNGIGRTGADLVAGDQIEARTSSQLRFNDGTVFILEPGTRVGLIAGQSHLNAAAKQIALSVGSLHAVVVHQPTGRPLSISTPEAELTVVGTAFSLSCHGAATRLRVTEGLVRVAAGGAEREVAAGSTIACDSTGFQSPTTGSQLPPGNAQLPTDVSQAGVADSPSPAALVTVTIGESAVLDLDDLGNGNVLCAQQVKLQQPGTLQSLSFFVTQASGHLRMGLYDASGPAGEPGKKLAECLDITPVVGWNTEKVTEAVALTAGLYWLVYLPSDGQLHFRKVDLGEVRACRFPYGVLPQIFSTQTERHTAHWSFYATLTADPVHAHFDP